MTIHARGYRPYTGGFGGVSAPWVITREALAQGLRHKGIRVLLILTLLWLAGLCFGVYVQVTVANFQRAMRWRGVTVDDWMGQSLLESMGTLHVGLSILSGLIAMLFGAGLIADDRRTQGLTLYLSRPISALEYALGKCLAVPLLLILTALLPGLILFGFYGMWQPVHDSGVFFAEYSQWFGRIFDFWMVTSLSYGGLVLCLSARTERRSAVIGLMAVGLFGGTVLYGIGGRAAGWIGDLMRHTSLPFNIQSVVTPELFERSSRTRQWQPDAFAVYVLSAGLFALALFLAWKRARSVEISE